MVELLQGHIYRRTSAAGVDNDFGPDNFIFNLAGAADWVPSLRKGLEAIWLPLALKLVLDRLPV